VSGSDAVVHGEDVSVTYGTVTALSGLDFRVEEGEVVGIIGPNGAGKSTLANAITGFRPYTGSLRFRGEEVAEQAAAALVGQGLIHCTEKRDLFGFMNVLDNLKMGAYSRDWSDADDRLAEIYSLFPRLEERSEQNAHTLSGGEQQMLAIGRSLMGDPDTLLLDEPTMGLAPVILEDISDALDEIADSGTTVVLCEQNVTFTLDHADRIYLLENGSFVREGTPETLLDDDYVRDVYLGG
jgi:branched-chain amino acid transport system ATP-binding protein